MTSITGVTSREENWMAVQSICRVYFFCVYPFVALRDILHNFNITEIKVLRETIKSSIGHLLYAKINN
jgi:hypothetical protein